MTDRLHLATTRTLWIAAVVLSTTGTGPSSSRLEHAVVLTQMPSGAEIEREPSPAGGMLRSNYGEGARLVVLDRDLKIRVLSKGLASACDPDISFDGKRVVFAGKRKPSDDWNIFEMGVDGAGLRQITRDLGNCRSPVYLSTLYTIVSNEPWYQIAFASTASGEVNEYGAVPANHIYTSRLDGSGVRRLTFNLSSDMDPFLMQDGRIVFASWQRFDLDRGFLGRVSLFDVNGDGTDLALFSAGEGGRIQHMPAVTTKGLVVFVEPDTPTWDGAGHLASVSLRRPLYSYRRIRPGDGGWFHSPSPLPDGSLLVSRRPTDTRASHSLYRLDPETGNLDPVYDHPDYHDIQANVIAPRPEPDGRSSVVDEQDPNGQLYCLSVHVSDLAPARAPAVRIRVLEGVARQASGEEGRSAACGLGIPPIAQKRILGDVPLERDGSFYVKVPANTPIQIQTLDESGMALRTCAWIWAKNHESRGCIGCHEDPELAPENRLVDALKHPAIDLTLPPERRRTVDFRRDVMPILRDKCALAACHGDGSNPPDLGEGIEARDVEGGGSCFNRAYRSLFSGWTLSGDAPPRARWIDPGRARTSPLVWSLFGKNTSRPWDRVTVEADVEPMPPSGSAPLTEEEKRTFVEWIDLGALWDGIPERTRLAGEATPRSKP